VVTKGCGDYITHQDWLNDVVQEDVIICYGSALEYLQWFVGYLNETEIDVFAKQKGIYENINYHIVDSFGDIEVITNGKVRCTTFNQTINDMLDDWDNMDESALAQALSDFYHKHNKTFGDLVVKPQHAERFEYMKDWAREFYNEY